ncbi:hypothetical protein PRVXH_002100 [Proteinivorax hydrogeniformans]|uniref:Uncharacterized protein n=1 Tax=Proteinivorax hydrogeniformans TaxID=1826727 RepID=A0AAU8HRH2_9FIRM
MRKSILSVFLVLSMLFLVISPASTVYAIEEVNFECEVLKERVRDLAGSLKVEDIENITEISIPEETSDLSGIQQLTGLEKITIITPQNDLDFSILNEIHSLKELVLNRVNIKEIEGLNQIKRLDIYYSTIGTIDGLANIDTMEMTNSEIEKVIGAYNLQTLRLFPSRNNEYESYEGIKQFEGFDNIKKLRVVGDYQNWSIFSETEVEILNLDYNVKRDLSLLKEFSKLKTLSTSTPLSPCYYKYVNELSELEWLSVRNTEEVFDNKLIYGFSGAAFSDSPNEFFINTDFLVDGDIKEHIGYNLMLEGPKVLFMDVDEVVDELPLVLKKEASPYGGGIEEANIMNYKELIYLASSNNEVVKIEDGKIIALAEGVAEINAYFAGASFTEVTIEVAVGDQYRDEYKSGNKASFECNVLENQVKKAAGGSLDYDAVSKIEDMGLDGISSLEGLEQLSNLYRLQISNPKQELDYSILNELHVPILTLENVDGDLSQLEYVSQLTIIDSDVKVKNGLPVGYLFIEDSEKSLDEILQIATRFEIWDSLELGADLDKSDYELIYQSSEDLDMLSSNIFSKTYDKLDYSWGFTTLWYDLVQDGVFGHTLKFIAEDIVLDTREVAVPFNIEKNELVDFFDGCCGGFAHGETEIVEDISDYLDYIYFTSSDEEVVKIKNGKIKAVGNGEVEVKAYFAGIRGTEVSATVTVEGLSDKEVEVTKPVEQTRESITRDELEQEEEVQVRSTNESVTVDVPVETWSRAIESALGRTDYETIEVSIDEYEKVEPTTQKELRPVSNVYRFSLEADGERISEFGDKIRMTFNYDPDLVENPESLSVFWLDPETDKWVAIDSELGEDNTIIGMTDHWSMFTVFEDSSEPEAKEEVSDEDEDDENPETGDSFSIIYVVLAALATFGLVVVRRRRLV